jgi:hypothetical protein
MFPHDSAKTPTDLTDQRMSSSDWVALRNGAGLDMFIKTHAVRVYSEIQDCFVDSADK